MAKKKTKVSDSSTPALGCEYSPSIYIDFEKLKEIEGVGVGDKISVVITGKVRSVEQRESYDDPGAYRASISLKDFKAEIVEDGENIFTELSKDDEDE